MPVDEIPMKVTNKTDFKEPRGLYLEQGQSNSYNTTQLPLIHFKLLSYKLRLGRPKGPFPHILPLRGCMICISAFSRKFYMSYQSPTLDLGYLIMLGEECNVCK